MPVGELVPGNGRCVSWKMAEEGGFGEPMNRLLDGIEESNLPVIMQTLSLTLLLQQHVSFYFRDQLAKAWILTELTVLQSLQLPAVFWGCLRRYLCLQVLLCVAVIVLSVGRHSFSRSGATNAD